MSDAAVIAGDFCTFRHVQGRKVLQIIIEVPAEAAGAVFAALGMPGSGTGIPVALARLVDDARVRPEHVEPIAKTEAPKERRPFSELPYSQQAAMRCREPDFSRFLAEKHHETYASVDNSVAQTVRTICGVDSRARLGDTPSSWKAWEDLEAEYWAWQRGRR